MPIREEVKLLWVSKTKGSMNFNRQFQYLKSLGNDILKEDGFVNHGQFYHKLEEYIKFYYEIKPLLIEVDRSNMFLKEKINLLPEFTFVDYDNPFSFKSIFFGIGYFIFFPLGIIYLTQKYRYVSGIKTKLRETYTLISSIEFLLKENE